MNAPWKSGIPGNRDPFSAYICDDNALDVYWNGGARTLGPAAKTEVAAQLMALVAERLDG